jgi:RNA polymerase sigma factor (sigma-70 family)
MQELDDIDLLRQYTENNSEEAFGAIVARHINKVYSVALRHTGNAHQAEEITQAVFVILAKKAAGLRQGVILSGWLYETARLTSITFLRSEIRRARREQEAYMQNILNEPALDETWKQIAPLLDAAMANLNKTDRHAVVLRFFDGKSIKEVGAALGTTEDTAKKRLSRAVEKLHRFFARRGVNSTTAIIAGVISSNSVQAAPITLAKTATVVAIAKGAAASASTLTLAKGALKVMAWTKTQTAVVAAIGLLLVATTSTVIVKKHFFPTEPGYQGRSLLHWLADVAPNYGPPDYGRPSAKQVQAVKAIRVMGTLTIPFLLADLGDKRFSHVHYAEPDKRTLDERSDQATWAFDALGSLGKSAVPELVKLLHQNPGYVPSALVGIGPDAMPELMGALTNEDFWVRDNTAAALANALYRQKITPAEAQAAFPVALNNLTYTSTNSLFRVNTRHRAAGLLGALHLNPEVAVPALIDGLNGKDPTVAMQCADSLGEFGEDAVPAIPALIDGMHNSNSMIAGQCAFALGNAGLVDSATAAIPDLIQGLSNTNGIIAFCCASTLRNFSPQALGAHKADVIAAFEKLADSNNVQLSSLASQAVNSIEGRR